MAEQWQVDGPRVVEVGSAAEPVLRLHVGLIGGRVDVIAHDTSGPSDPDDAQCVRVEVTRVHGRPLDVSWRDGELWVGHPKVKWDSIFDGLKSLSRGEAEAELSIAVPAGVRVHLSTVSADGLLSGLRAPVTVHTVSGEVVVDQVSGEVGARTVSGRIDVRGLDGSLSGNSVSGSLTVQASRLPRLDAKTVSGELVVDLERTPSTLHVKTVSGDLVVRIPTDAGYRLDARTVSGAIVADGRRLRSGRPGPPQGEIRDGDESVRVSATSVSGDVTLLRRQESSRAGQAADAS